jgi:hypothetical protein
MEWRSHWRPETSDTSVLEKDRKGTLTMNKKPLLRLQGIDAAPMSKETVGEAYRAAKRHRLVNNLSPWKRKPKTK